MSLKNILKSYWVPILLVILGGVLEYLTFSTTAVPLWLIGIIVIIVGMLQLYSQIMTDRGGAQTAARLEKQVEKLQEISKEQDEHIKQLSTALNQKQKAGIVLVGKLIDRGLISQADVIKHLEGIDTFFLYCYANRLPAPSDKARIARLYPTFLKNEGFVRVGNRSGFFVITAKKLTKRLQDTPVLYAWLMKELKNQLAREWTAQLTKLNTRRYMAYYQKYRNDKYTDHLNMNILLTKIKLRSDNIGIINKNIFPKDFVKLINEDLKLGKIEINEEQKVQVRKFVLDSSFELFFSEVPKNDLNKLLRLESRLKQQLNINSFIDYTQQAEQDMTNILKSSFNAAKASEYANMLKSRAKDYVDALKEMGISTA